jgi:carboxymethylenebutenolidase
MSTTTRQERIHMPDGGDMGAYVAVPESGHGPGILVLMEIFGVGSYIRRAAERLAELGYVALAPDLYRRTDPGAEFDHNPAGLEEAFAAAGRMDAPGAVGDSLVALDYLRGLPEVQPPVGVLGFCLGGSLAFQVAVEGDPAVAVSYYGASVPEALAEGERVTCPVIFHFGAKDQFIALEEAELVAAAAGERPEWECHIQADGGHAFDNHDSEMFYQPEPAARAWALTSEFLARELPVSP